MTAIFQKGHHRYQVLSGYRVDGSMVEGDIEGHVIKEGSGESVASFNSFDGLILTGYLEEIPNEAPMPLLTDLELKAARLSGELANLLAKIIREGGDSDLATGDWREACAKIHDIQHMIMAQAAARAFPNEFRLLGNRGAWREDGSGHGDAEEDRGKSS